MCAGAACPTGAHPPDSYNPEVYVNDVLGLLKSEGIDKAISLGTSMGGIMTMILAAKRPELLAGALINDIGPELDPAGLDRIAGYVGRTTSAFENWHEAAEAIRAVNGDAFPDETGEDFWMAFARRTCRELESGRVELDYDPAIAEPFRQPDRALPPDMWPLYDALAPVPLVVVRGAISDLLSHESFEKMKARHPHFTGVEIPRVGHAPLLDRAARTRKPLMACWRGWADTRQTRGVKGDARISADTSWHSHPAGGGGDCRLCLADPHARACPRRPKRYRANTGWTLQG